jgi:hypothetical protein
MLLRFRNEKTLHRARVARVSCLRYYGSCPQPMNIRISISSVPGKQTSQLGLLPLLLVLLFLIVGSLLLNDGASNSDASQTVRVITGAMFLSLGLISICVALRKWWKLKRIYKGTDDQ